MKSKIFTVIVFVFFSAITISPASGAMIPGSGDSTKSLPETASKLEGQETRERAQATKETNLGQNGQEKIEIIHENQHEKEGRSTGTDVLIIHD